jgi:hypothetical protein
MTDVSTTDGESVRIRTTEHRLTQEEVVPVVYRQVVHRWQNWILPLVGACLVAAGATVLGLDPADTVAWVVMLTLGLVILLIFLVLVPVTPDRIWRRVSRQFETRTLEITDEGIHRHTALNDNLMRWPMFSGVRRRDELYLLMVGNGPGCFIIPARAFTSEADETTFRALAERSTSASSGTARA